MAGEAVQGMADTYALLGELPAAARFELADLLGRLGRDILAREQAIVAKATGALQAGLSSQLLTDQLRVRVGLLGLARSSGKKNLGGLFYGIIVNYGRKAQTVLVDRRRAGATKLLRNGRKRVEDLLKTYSLRVTPLAPRPFVDGPEIDVDGIATQRLADFWSGVFSRTGAAA